MKHLSFIQLSILGFGLSLLGAVGVHSLNIVLTMPDALLATCLVLIFVYISYLLYKTKIQTGRLLVFIAYPLINLGFVALLPSALLILTANLMILWLVRSLYFHRCFIAIVCDASLTFFGAAAAYLVLSATSSWFLVFWSFFLIQALLPLLPKSIGKNIEQTIKTENHLFSTAYHNAESAINQLIKH